jgi:PKD repeat protein
LLKYLWTRVRISPPSPATGFVPFTVGFDASGSTVEKPTIVSYTWDFNGDGTIDATVVTAVHTFTTVGTYLVKLTVTDSAAKTYVAFVTVIANEAP